MYDRHAIGSFIRKSIKRTTPAKILIASWLHTKDCCTTSVDLESAESRSPKIPIRLEVCQKILPTSGPKHHIRRKCSIASILQFMHNPSFHFRPPRRPPRISTGLHTFKSRIIIPFHDRTIHFTQYAPTPNSPTTGRFQNKYLTHIPLGRNDNHYFII